MKKIWVIFLSIIYFFVAWFAVFAVSAVFIESDIIWLIATICALLFAIFYYFSRKDDEKCQKCGALWSVKFIDKATLTQSAIKQKMTTYLVGDEKLIYRCNQCGNETSKVQRYKREA